MLLVEVLIGATTYRISNEDLALTHPWDAYVASFTPPSYESSHDYGGFFKLGFGTIEIYPTFFTEVVETWPPSVELGLTIKYTTTTEAAATTMFQATGYRKSGFLDKVSYQLFSDSYGTQLLSTIADYNGNTVPLPRAFGNVTHVNPVRLPDVGGKPVFHNGYVEGTLDTDWHVYDDGVDVCSNVTDNADYTFTFNVAFVGEVTISGAGEYGTGSDDKLGSIIEWACGASYLNLTYNGTLKKSVQPSVSYWANSQDTLIDFLGGLASFYYHLFYISGTTLYLVDMDTDNGTTVLEIDFDAVDVRYFDTPPIKIIRSKWGTRAAVTEAIGAYVKNYEHETSATSAYPYGTELDIKPYHDTITNISAQQSTILTYLHKAGAEITIPFDAAPPLPGGKVTWTDTQVQQSTDGLIRVHQSISYDFNQNTITLKGKGAVTAT